MYQYGQTALHWAALNGRIQIVQYLITSGADIKIKSKVSNSLIEAIDMSVCLIIYLPNCVYLSLCLFTCLLCESIAVRISVYARVCLHSFVCSKGYVSSSCYYVSVSHVNVLTILDNWELFAHYNYETIHIIIKFTTIIMI